MSDSDNTATEKHIDKLPRFPYKRMYLVIISILIPISIFGLTFQTDDATSSIWKISTSFQVTSITLVLFVLAWLPFLIPWIYDLAPHISAMLRWLRDQGIEEIGIPFGNITIKLNAAAKEYQKTVLQPVGRELPVGPIEKQLDRGYQEAIKLAKESQHISAQDALKQVDELAGLYDQVRNKRDLGGERVQLMKEISAAMWSLMPHVEEFAVRDRLLSHKGGVRLSAYKYLEWRPSSELLDLLLSRSIGTLETPFGQYAALLALRRVLGQTHLTAEQRQMVQTTLRWYLQLGYSGEDRRNLIEGILSRLK